MQLEEIIRLLEEIAPPELADPSDAGKIGLVLERKSDIYKIATSLDVNVPVLKEAARAGADLLVAHHTPIYEPVNHISKTLADILKTALDNDISIYVMHTNYDSAPGGVNDILAELLELSDVRTAGFGRIGNVAPTDTEELAGFTARRLDTHVSYIGDHEIETVMVMGGSGLKGEYIEMALDGGADAFISAEMRHDVIPYARDISLIDATHYATENPAMLKLVERLPVDSLFIDHRPQVHVIV